MGFLKGNSMKTKILLLSALLFLLMVPLQASAFDGERKGFMLNLGLGFGQGKLDVGTGGLSAGVDATGFGTDFKIGGGASDQVLIYYTNRALWYSPSVGPVSADLVNGMSAAGVSYFLEPQAPSVFFSGALGLGVLLDSDAEEADSGFGFTFGVGFEFARSFIAELTYMRAGVGSEDFGGVNIDATISSIMVTVSWLAY